MTQPRRPYTLRMGRGPRVVGFYKTADEALAAGRGINKNRLRSGGPECVEGLLITLDLPGQGQTVVHSATARAERREAEA